MRLTHSLMCYLLRQDVRVKVAFNSTSIERPGKLYTYGWDMTKDSAMVMFPTLHPLDGDEWEDFQRWIARGHDVTIGVEVPLEWIELVEILVDDKDLYAALVEVFGGLVRLK